MIEEYIDQVTLATQLGRLDLISTLLAGIGIVLVFGGIFAFLNFRSIAKEQATQVATKVAEEVAETAANDYLQANLVEIMSAYSGFSGAMNAEGISSEGAGEIAKKQDISEEET